MGASVFFGDCFLDIMSAALKGEVGRKENPFNRFSTDWSSAERQRPNGFCVASGGGVDLKRKPKLPCSSDGTQCSRRYVQWLNDWRGRWYADGLYNVLNANESERERVREKE